MHDFNTMGLAICDVGFAEVNTVPPMNAGGLPVSGQLKFRMSMLTDSS